MTNDTLSTKDKILQAAAEIAKGVGPVHLSLDAVARRAGLSKGGLLYTFPTKAKLLEALVEQHVSEFDESLRREEAARNHGPNSVVLACIAVYRAEFLCNEPEPSAFLRRLLTTRASLSQFAAITGNCCSGCAKTLKIRHW